MRVVSSMFQDAGGCGLHRHPSGIFASCRLCTSLAKLADTKFSQPSAQKLSLDTLYCKQHVLFALRYSDPALFLHTYVRVSLDVKWLRYCKHMAITVQPP